MEHFEQLLIDVQVHILIIDSMTAWYRMKFRTAKFVKFSKFFKRHCQHGSIEADRMPENHDKELARSRTSLQKWQDSARGTVYA